MTVSGTHREHEAYPWTVNVGNHPQRTESPGYRRSRALMTDLVKTAQPWVLGDPPYQDHHRTTMVAASGSGMRTAGS